MGSAFFESYARYIEHSRGVTVAVDAADPYYCDGRATGEVFRDFLEWALEHSTFVDVEEAVKRPGDLAVQCGLRPACIKADCRTAAETAPLQADLSENF